MSLKQSLPLMVPLIFNIGFVRYLGIEKEHNPWEYIIIFYLDVPIYHMQHLTMDLENEILKFIITDRHIFIQKISSYQKKTEKIRSRRNVFF